MKIIHILFLSYERETDGRFHFSCIERKIYLMKIYKMELFFQIMIKKFIKMVVVLGALNWGFIGMFRFNLITFITQRFTPIKLNRTMYSIVGLCALLQAFDRDFYLPFLGETVFPCDSMTLKVPIGADTITDVKVRRNRNVIYWASNGTTAADIIVQNPALAYNKYSNSGVALSDENGIAQLKFKYPQGYKTPLGNTLKPHVHYRVCLGDGMMSSIKTVFLK